MANGIYTLSRKAFLDGEIDLLDNDIKAALVRVSGNGTTYTANLATDEFLSDINADAIVDTSANLASKSTTGGVFDAADVVFSAVTADDPCALVLYQDTGNSETSRLLAYFDTGTGLPVTPNGEDITVQWSSGDARIFRWAPAA